MAAVVVTGANKGIGLSIVKGLVAGGVRTFLGSRDVERGNAAKQSLGPEAVRASVEGKHGMTYA